jgi:hypothetical protein
LLLLLVPCLAHCLDQVVLLHGCIEGVRWGCSTCGPWVAACHHCCPRTGCKLPTGSPLSGACWRLPGCTIWRRCGLLDISVK